VSRKFILRYRGAGPAPRRDVETFRKAPETRLLDESARMLLVEGDAEKLQAIVRGLRSWSMSEESWVPLPDPRESVRSR
jgi:hypothetical protein